MINMNKLIKYCSHKLYHYYIDNILLIYSYLSYYTILLSYLYHIYHSLVGLASIASGDGRESVPTNYITVLYRHSLSHHHSQYREK